MTRNIPATLPSASKALEHLDRLESEIDSATSFEAVEAARRTAKAYAEIFKPVKEVSDRGGEVWEFAEIKIATEKERLGNATGIIGRSKKGQTRGSKGVPRVDEPPTIAELGLNKKVLQRGKKLRALGVAKRKAIKAKLKAEGKPINPNTILAGARTAAKAERRQEMIEAVFSDTGPFDVVVIDPPWDMQKIDRDERPNQDAFDYDTMSLEEIEAFWLRQIEPKTKDDCHLFCWTTEKYLPATINLLGLWGYRYVLTMVWHKPGGFQPIGLPQYNAEFAVYGRKGSPLFIDTTDFNVCNSWPRREHSRKPAEFYQLIKRVTGGSRLDVFAREAHDGFARMGKEIDRFTEAAE